MRQTVLGGTASAIGWGVLVVVLVLSPTLGSASSVVALALMLMLSPAAGRPGALAEIRQAPAQLMFIGVVVVLTLAYAITAREPTDILFFANFLAMPLSAVVYLIARKHTGKATALLIIRLCLLGALLGLGFALFDIFSRGLDRAQGLIGNPNLMPRIALTLGFVSMAGVFADTGRRRYIYAIGPVAAIATTFLCGSRGAALAIPAMVLIAAIFLWQDRATRVFLGVLLAAAAVVVAAFYFRPAIGRFQG
ncbi:MAG: hypothetical protein EOP19_24260, partial [Hyphomicrobiales bacterium]